MNSHSERSSRIDVPPNKTREENVDEFWFSIQAEVETALRKYVKERYRAYDPEEQEENYREALAGEEALVKETLMKAERMLGERATQGRILFDVDNTLGRAAYDSEGENIIGFSFRPAALFLLRHLKEKFPSLAIGFLTTRGRQGGVLDQLRQQDFLGPMSPYVDEREVYSTRDVPERDSMDVEGEYNYLTRHPDVDQAVLNPENFYGLTPGEISKLEILKNLHERAPAISTIVVDDQSFPQYLKNGVRAKYF